MDAKFLLILVLASTFVSAQWEDCPFGLINDTYPGECGRYIDTNGDGICDRSQEQPTTTQATFASTTSTTKQTTTTTQAVNKQIIVGTKYNVIPITVALTLIYLISFFISKKGVIPVSAHRKLWNILLTAAFIVTGFSAVLIAVKLDLGWSIPLIADLLFWHTEFGLAMVWIALFHMLWHWRYYLSYLKKKKKESTTP
jgi:hypothetical protein